MEWQEPHPSLLAQFIAWLISKIKKPTKTSRVEREQLIEFLKSKGFIFQEEVN